MKSLKSLFAALGLALAAAPLLATPPPALEARVTMPAAPLAWEAWGTSLCWEGRNHGQRDDFADILFTLKDCPLNGRTLPELGFNYARYNVGDPKRARPFSASATKHQ